MGAHAHMSILRYVCACVHGDEHDASAVFYMNNVIFFTFNTLKLMERVILI